MWNRTRPAGLVLGVTLLAGIALGRMGLHLSAPVGAQDVPAADAFPVPAKASEPEAPPSLSEEPFGVEPVAPSLEPMPALTPTTAAPNDAAVTLRQELLELTQQRANLLSAEQLVQAVDKARSSLLITQAEQELEECLERLEQVAQKYPNTAAGLRAKGLLQQGRDPAMLAPMPSAPFVPDPTPFPVYRPTSATSDGGTFRASPTPIPESSPFSASDTFDPASPVRKPSSTKPTPIRN